MADLPPLAEPHRPISLGQLGLLLGFLRPYRLRVAGALLALVLGAASVLALGQGLRMVVDRGFVTGTSAELDRALFAMLAIVMAMAAATYVRFYLVSWLGERVTADLRRNLFDHLLRLPPGYFELARTGELLSRLTSDATMLETVIGSSVSLALRNLLMLAGSLVMLAITSVKLTLFVVLGVPLVVVPILLFGRRLRRYARLSQDRLAEAGAYADEVLHEIRTVQAWGHEELDRRHFAARIEAVVDTAAQRIRQRAGLIALVIVLSFAAVGFILWVGGHDVLAGRISPGELSAFIFYATLAAMAVGAVSEVYGDLQRAAGATERIAELLATAPDIRAPAHPVPLPQPPRGTVEFRDVVFAYPSRPETPALDHFSLAVAPGEKLALVGPSGAGKTTVFQLLLRFYDVQAGVICLDGVDLRAADPAQLRRRIALVPQEPVMFAASVRDNVRYGRPEAGEEEILEACRAAFALEFVERLPQGLDTYLGERGVRLSGGQRQRIAIARAIVSDRPILLLDEATSALDAESERKVQLALEHLMRGRTTLVIAHRLATVKNADRIAVMEHGRVVGVGRHEELVRSNPLYARLAELQFGRERALGAV